MKRSAMVGVISLLAAVEMLLPNPSAGSDTDDAVMCRLPQRAAAHWLRPLSDRPSPDFGDTARQPRPSRLLGSD